MSLDIRKKIATRKYTKPNPVVHFVYYLVGRTKLLGAKYKPTFEIIEGPQDCKGACFVIWNHQSRRDHTFITSAVWPRRVSIVAQENEFFRSHLKFAFKHEKILPKKVFCASDMVGLRAIRNVIKQGGCVAFSPEGTSSIFGDNQPIVPGTGSFFQAFGVPVYCAYLQGSYLTNNKCCSDDRLGKVFLQMKLLFSPEDLKNLSGAEIEEKINEAFHHDDYKWNKEHHIKYESHGTICKGLSDILYKCPRCGKEFEMESKDNYIKCNSCGNMAIMDDYYDFHKNDDSCVIPETPSDWAHYERQCLINEIREDKDYCFKFRTKIGTLPNDHYLKHYKTSELCGEGEYSIDHTGVHFKGTKNGESFSFDQSYNQVFSYPIAVDVSDFSLYVDNEYYEFYPELPCAGKVIMLTEEMHRYHVNRWKNFPWFDYMYEGKELGIDCKE